MTTFIQNLDHTLKNIEDTKKFLKSPETHRAIALKNKKWHWEIPEEAWLFLMIVTLIPTPQLLWKFSPSLLTTTLVLGGLCAVFMYLSAVSSGVDLLLRKWKKNAALLGLGKNIVTKDDFNRLNKTPTLSERVETIEICQLAGATANQITQLYALSSDNLPSAWWDTLRAKAHTEMQRLTAEKVKQNKMHEQEERDRLAHEKIQAHLNPTVEVEQMPDLKRESTKNEFCSGIKL